MKLKVYSKRMPVFFAVFLFITAKSYSIIPQLDVVDTPTAITLPRATYNLSFWGYENGGILTKAVMGLSDGVYLGASFDVQNAIGAGKPKFNVPGVIAKIRLTEGWQDYPFFLAFGYDAYYTGRTKEGEITLENRIIYGPHISFTKPIFLLGGEQHFHMGVRVPVQPGYLSKDTEVYAGFDFPIGYFVPMIEIERVFFNSKRSREVLMNIGLRFNILEGLAVELDLMTGFDRRPTRMLIFEFMGYF
ncbi:MAG: hypothetical protein OEZ13_12640 [Spirochaetia bacterium]|nr:hypothetical protein [Spirochaetia bacterium]